MADVYGYVLSVLKKFKIDFKNIISISTDSASYMKAVVKAFQEKITNLLYFPCLAHIANLVLQVFVNDQIFSDLHILFSKFHYIFSISGTRKARYLNMIKESGVIEPKVFPRVVLTRWLAWFTGSYYLRDYIDIGLKFLLKENKEESKCESLEEISKILLNENKFINIKVCLEFIYEFSFNIIKELRIFESDSISRYDLYLKMLKIKKFLKIFLEMILIYFLKLRRL